MNAGRYLPGDGPRGENNDRQKHWAVDGRQAAPCAPVGWTHEFADVARPITAAFAGAPGNSFTVFRATPLRNAAVVGLQATTNIAAATQIYLRYDGEIATGTDNHALTVGVRMSW